MDKYNEKKMIEVKHIRGVSTIVDVTGNYSGINLRKENGRLFVETPGAVYWVKLNLDEKQD